MLFSKSSMVIKRTDIRTTLSNIQRSLFYDRDSNKPGRSWFCRCPTTCKVILAVHTKNHTRSDSTCIPQVCNLIKKESVAQVFSCEFWEISKNTFFTEHLRTTASESSSESCQIQQTRGCLDILLINRIKITRLRNSETRLRNCAEKTCVSYTLREVSKYGVIFGLYFPAFGPEITPYLDTFQAVIKLK